MAEQPSAQAESAAPQQPRKGNGRRKWYLLGLALVFVLIAIVYAVYYFLIAQFYISTDDAYVEGNAVMLTPQIRGTVVAIQADDTDLVHAGQTVVTLDHTDADNALAQASAQLAEAVREVRQLYAQVDEQQATIQALRRTLEQARRDYERNRRLVKAHGVTRQAFEHSHSAYEESRDRLAAAQHKLAELKARTEGTILRTHPRVKAAEARLRSAYLNVRRTRIPAPVTGYVAQRNVQLGQKVDPSKPMLAIVPINQLWVDANFKETKLASVRIGQPATVTTDFYGSDVVYHGRVAGISPGTGSAFELLPPQNATGNWIKVVRRIPVRIVLDDPKVEKKHPLRLGLSTKVTVNLHDTRGPVLAKAPPNKPRYVTRVYQQRLDGANRLVRQIVAANAGHAAHSGKSSARP